MVRAINRPLTTDIVQIGPTALRIARFVGIEVCFDNGRERRQLNYLIVVERVGPNEKPVDLGE